MYWAQARVQPLCAKAYVLSYQATIEAKYYTCFGANLNIVGIYAQGSDVVSHNLFNPCILLCSLLN